jgi:preprotein translocase subunit SecG
VSGLAVYVQIVQIIISVALVAVILVQAKGQSAGLGGIFGGDGGGIYRTRRGVERTLYHVTIGLAVAFLAVSIISVLAA